MQASGCRASVPSEIASSRHDGQLRREPLERSAGGLCDDAAGPGVGPVPDTVHSFAHQPSDYGHRACAEAQATETHIGPDGFTAKRDATCDLGFCAPLYCSPCSRSWALFGPNLCSDEIDPAFPLTMTLRLRTDCGTAGLSPCVHECPLGSNTMCVYHQRLDEHREPR